MALRVLYAPRNISGQAGEYALAVRAFGIEAEVWSYGPAAFGFPVDVIVDLARWERDPGYRWEIFDDAVRRFDVFHFQYAGSLLRPHGHDAPDLWDLPMLKSLGKRVFMHFRGSDVRLRSHHLTTESDSYFRYSDIPCDEDSILGRISICRRFCDGLFVSTPGLLDYVPDAEWIPHVLDPSEWIRPRRPERAVPIVSHIPSRRGTKGSDHIDAVLRHLDKDGVCCYRPLHDVNRRELRAALQDADLVVDSIGIGDHGLISVEAMAAGAIALAHIHQRNRERNPGVPVVEVTRDTLGDVVRELAADPRRRAELREEGFEWVRRRHDRRDVGLMLAECYRRRPVTVVRSYPGWPRSEDRARVEALEAQVDYLQAKLQLPPPAIEGLAERMLPLRIRIRRHAVRSRLVRRVYRAVQRWRR